MCVAQGRRLSKIAYPVDKHTVALPQIINANSNPTTTSTKLTPQHFSNTGHIPFFTLAMIPKNKMSHLQLFHLNPSMVMPFIPIQSIKPYPLSHLIYRIGNLINK